MDAGPGRGCKSWIDLGKEGGFGVRSGQLGQGVGEVQGAEDPWVIYQDFGGGLEQNREIKIVPNIQVEYAKIISLSFECLILSC